jgi:hypothetical protein
VVNLFDERFSSPSLRALLAMSVVFVMLATTGWTAMRSYTSAPDARTAAISAWLHGSVGGRRLPNPAAGSNVIAHFLAGLTPVQRERLAIRYPLVVGNLNGAPVSLRYEANHRSLVAARAAETKRAHSSLLTEDGRQQATQLVSTYESLLSGKRQILTFDPTGRGRIAEVLGNLDTASRVAIVVPGVDTDVLHFERASQPYQAPLGMAQALYTSERAAAPSAHTAVIAWADYTTPSGVGLDASTGELAGQGAARLKALVSALPGHSSVSLFCHSYGSVLCGVAAPGLTVGKVTDIAVFGSPGMRVKNAAGLHTRARIWAARDSTDWIGDVPHLEIAGLGHGADPVSKAFGARVVTSAGAEGHAGYFAAGTGSLANFTRIALGHYTSVRLAQSA